MILTGYAQQERVLIKVVCVLFSAMDLRDVHSVKKIDQRQGKEEDIVLRDLTAAVPRGGERNEVEGRWSELLLAEMQISVEKEVSVESMSSFVPFGFASFISLNDLLHLMFRYFHFSPSHPDIIAFCVHLSFGFKVKNIQGYSMKSGPEFWCAARLASIYIQVKYRFVGKNLR